MRLKNKIYLEEGHDLIMTNNREEGNMGQNRFYYYDEIDTAKNVIARYESWDCTSQMPPFSTSTGYKKFDLSGNLLEEETF